MYASFIFAITYKVNPPVSGYGKLKDLVTGRVQPGGYVFYGLGLSHAANYLAEQIYRAS